MTEQSQRALDRNDDHVAEATERVAPIVAGVPVRLASLSPAPKHSPHRGSAASWASPEHQDAAREPLPRRC